MKKKAVETALFTVALSAVMCLGFAACGGEKTEDDAGDKENQVIVSDKVTEAEWNAAFEKNNFTNVKVELSSRGEGTEEYEGKNLVCVGIETETIVIADGRYHVFWDSQGTTKTDGVVTESKHESGVEYADKKADNTYFVYKKEGSEWTVSAENSFRIYRINSYMLVFDEKFNYLDFTYSDEAKGYVWVDEWESSKYEEKIKDRYTIKIKDGKIATCSVVFNENMVGNEKITIEANCTYGGQTVALPEVEFTPYGAYKFSSVTVKAGGVTQTYNVGDEMIDGTVLTEGFLTLTLNKDGTARLTSDLDGADYNPTTYTMAGNDITVKIDGGTQTFKWDGYCTLTMTEDKGITIVLKK